MTITVDIEIEDEAWTTAEADAEALVWRAAQAVLDAHEDIEGQGIVILLTDDEFRARVVKDLIESKAVRRSLSLKIFDGWRFLGRLLRKEYQPDECECEGLHVIVPAS